jgi:hypothetical protein
VHLGIDNGHKAILAKKLVAAILTQDEIHRILFSTGLLLLLLLPSVGGQKKQHWRRAISNQVQMLFCHPVGKREVLRWIISWVLVRANCLNLGKVKDLTDARDKSQTSDSQC